MEIELGEFYFKAEGSVAILLAATPVIAIITLPKVVEALKRIIYLVRRYKRQTLQEYIDKAYK